MQNHPGYKTTPEQGWAQMAPILDRAMPVARRSRRFLFYWLSAAAIVLAIVITRFVMMDVISNQQDPVIAKDNEKEMPVITNPAQTSGPYITSNTGTETEHTTGTDKINGTASPETVTSTDEDSGISKAQHERNRENILVKPSTKNNLITSPVSPNTNTQNIVPTQPSPTPSIIAQSEETQPTVAGEITEQSILGEETNDFHTPSTRSDIAVAFLPAYSLDGLTSPDFTMHDIAPGSIKPAMRKKNLFTVHVDASVLETYETGIGAYAGAGLDVNILPRLSITTGIGCSIYNPELTLSSTNKDRTSFEESEALLRSDLGYSGIGTYLPADAFNNSSPSVIKQFVQTIRQWHFSAGLKYDLSRRFFVEGGASFNLLASTYSKYPIVSFLVVNDPLTGGNLDVSHSLDEYNLVTSHTTSMYAGLGYRPGKKTEVFAQWVQGMDNYLTTPSLQEATGNKTDYARGLNLGIRYNL